MTMTMASQVTMNLYHLTLQRSTCITNAVLGNFSGKKSQEIVVARGHTIELLQPDVNTGKIYPMLSVEVFGVVRSLTPFRTTGGSKDYVIVGTDSGRIVILEYNAAHNRFDRVQMETFGKSGCRRIVPGQYLAVDPKGRAVMIAAAEKQKLVYILNRDAAARLTISSPLEAHKSNTIVFHCVGVDVGFDNPVFACLEMDYEDADTDPTGEAAAMSQQQLTFYELDLGLNHVVRKYSEPLDEPGNLLLVVPGGNDGPSGVIVCCEGYVRYAAYGDTHSVRCTFPRRNGDPSYEDSRGPLVVASTIHKTKSMFFFLLQTEQGDLFKLTMDISDDVVMSMCLKYFDTVTVASAMCVMRTGFLFVAAEFGNHAFYQIQGLGDNDGEPEFISADEDRRVEEAATIALTASGGDEAAATAAGELARVSYFQPRALRNLMLVDDLDSLSPITTAAVTDLCDEDTPQIFALCGRGPRSSLRVLRHGLEVSEFAVSEMPGNPTAIWTARLSSADEYDAYIVVSFLNATLVLSIGETVEEVTDSGFMTSQRTLWISQLGEDTLIQVHPLGIRHILADRRVNEWKVPAGHTIRHATSNSRQVVVALTGGDLIYFELDPTGTLSEFNERRNLGTEVVCLVLSPVPQGRIRGRFLAVGSDDSTVRLLTLDPDECMQPLGMQALPAPATSLVIAEMGGGADVRRTYLMVGLNNGVLLWSLLDESSGSISDTRTRYLGSRHVKLVPINVRGDCGVLALSSRSWLSYMHQARVVLMPMSYEVLDHATGFASEQCPEGIVAIAGKTLRIIAVEKLGNVFNSTILPLSMTPRKVAVHSASQRLVIIESDHHRFSASESASIAARMNSLNNSNSNNDVDAMDVGSDNDDEKDGILSETEFGVPRAPAGRWASCVRLVNGATLEVLHLVNLAGNEAALSVTTVQFDARGDSETFVVVGTAVDLQLKPKRYCRGGNLHTFLLVSDPANPAAGPHRLELLHVTPVEDAPGALCSFQGRLLVSVGKLVRIYELGKKKLLRKCENKHVPRYVVSLQTIGSRIIVGDVQESVHWLKYRAAENQLVIFADETSPRWLTATLPLDFNTVAGADKFGNIFVARLPADVQDNIDDDPTGVKVLLERGLLNGAPQKMITLANFHIGDTITSLHKATLTVGGSESIVYTTVLGAVGVLVPITNAEDRDFFEHVEMKMREVNGPLCGRDHLSYRSYYFPRKAVVDGDLCEQFNALAVDKKNIVSEDLDRSSAEMAKKLQDIRMRYAF